MRILRIDQIQEPGSCEHNNDTLSFSSFSINKHIDKFTVSIRESHFMEEIDKALEGIGYKPVRDSKIREGNYDMNREYRHSSDKVKINILHGLKNTRPRMPELLLTVHDPNLEFINYLKAVFEYHHIEPKLSNVELTFDFHTTELWPIFWLLRRHLYMYYQRTPSDECRYTTTFYANDIRRSAYGIKVYIRSEERLVRLELTLKRGILRKHNIGPFLDGIEGIDVSQFFTFCKHDADGLRDYLYKYYKSEIDRLKSEDPRKASFFVCHLEAWLRCAVGGSESLMGKLEVMKAKNGVRNYARYFAPFTVLNSRFNEEANVQHFIKKRD